jgi:carbonic anhydrase
MAPFDDVLEANAAFAETFQDPGRPGRAGRGLAVLTCMDSRIDPLAALGLQLGDAKILRNAGAQVTDEVLRNLIVATHVLGVTRVVVMGHTECGMTKATDDDVHQRALDSGVDTRSVDIGTIRDQRATLARDVQRISSSPFLPKALAVLGCLYDVKTGRVEVVVPPTTA